MERGQPRTPDSILKIPASSRKLVPREKPRTSSRQNWSEKRSLLPHDLVRLFISSQSQKNRLPELVIERPFLILCAVDDTTPSNTTKKP